MGEDFLELPLDEKKKLCGVMPQSQGTSDMMGIRQILRTQTQDMHGRNGVAAHTTVADGHSGGAGIPAIVRGTHLQ